MEKRVRRAEPAGEAGLESGIVQAQVQPSPQTADVSTQIGQLLYAMSLSAASNDCDCEICQMARRLGGLLARQLKQGPAFPRV